jgi:hypothetical protein
MSDLRIAGSVVLASFFWVPPAPVDAQSVTVAFDGCVESIGVALLPIDDVRAEVPDSFVLAGEGGPVTPLAVRTAHCDDIRIGRYRAGEADIVQIGAVVVPPDGTGDINNYLLWYQTTNIELALVLNLLYGVSAEYVPRIDYQIGQTASDGSAPFHVRVRLPGSPRLSIDGRVTAAGFPASNFVAIWWEETHRGRVRMSTFVASGTVGSAALALTTPARSELADLIGATDLGFPILQQFNTLHGVVPMTVTVERR